jgi:hypothetical protein
VKIIWLQCTYHGQQLASRAPVPARQLTDKRRTQVPTVDATVWHGKRRAPHSSNRRGQGLLLHPVHRRSPTSGRACHLWRRRRQWHELQRRRRHELQRRRLQRRQRWRRQRRHELQQQQRWRVHGTPRHARGRERVHGTPWHARGRERVHGTPSHARGRGRVHGTSGHARRQQWVHGTPRHARRQRRLHGTPRVIRGRVHGTSWHARRPRGRVHGTPRGRHARGRSCKGHRPRPTAGRKGHRGTWQCWGQCRGQPPWGIWRPRSAAAVRTPSMTSGSELFRPHFYIAAMKHAWIAPFPTTVSFWKLASGGQVVAAVVELHTHALLCWRLIQHCDLTARLCKTVHRTLPPPPP